MPLRSAAFSIRIGASFARSPSETIPINSPFAITGIHRIFMLDIFLPVDESSSSGAAVITGEVMISHTRVDSGSLRSAAIFSTNQFQ